MKKFFFSVLAVWIFMLSLYGCGGGGGGSSTTTTPIGTAVNLSQIKSFIEGTAAPGTAATFNASGTTSTGHNVSGTFSFTVSGATTTTTPLGTQTVNIVQQYSSITDHTTNGTISGISTSYVYQSGYLYKVVDSDGTTATASSQVLMPASAKVGDFSNYETLNYSDGSTEVSTWRLDAGTNGDAILVFNYTMTDSLNQLVFTEEDRYTIKPDGSISALSTKLYLASLGISITMSGNRM